MIYPTMREDYYPKCWSGKEYEQQVDVLLDNTHFLGFTDEEFVSFNLLEKIWQVIKRCLGFTDYTETYRVQAAWMKFLYYGEAQGLLDNDQVGRLSLRIKQINQPLDPIFKRMFEEIEAYHTMPIRLPTHLSLLRQHLSDFHQRHALELRPGLWSRWMTPPSLDPTKLAFFGDLPLLFAEQALKEDTPQPLQALNYLKQAFVLKNSQPAFQRKLAQQLHAIDADEASWQIQRFFIDLAQTAFENGLTDEANAHLDHVLKATTLSQSMRIRIGKLYLDYQQDQHALPYLPLLKANCAHDPDRQFQIAQVYWQDEQYTEALDCYENSLKTYQQKLVTCTSQERSSSYHKQMALIHDRIGQIYFEKLLPAQSDHLKLAIASFAAAVKANSLVSDYQTHLCEAYQQQWETDASHFHIAYASDWLHFLSFCENPIVEKHQAKIIDMLLDCSEYFFQSQDNKKAHICLKKAIGLFDNRIEYILKGLRLAIQYQDWEPLESFFANWEKEHYANPYLKMYIGDAYWNKQRSTALKKYQEALDFFTKRLLIYPDEERAICQDHMAQIRVKIGNNQLQAQPGIFRSVPYDAALQNLQAAFQLDPKHAPQLFEAYLAAAKNESQRTRLMRDNYKIIDYYQQAFNTLPQNGDYLQELMKLYMDYSKYQEALTLYQAIQKQSWASEFKMSAEFYSKIGKDALDKENPAVALELLKKAYDLQPDCAAYKREYFQQTLNWAKKQYEDIQKDPTEDKLIELVKALKVCDQLNFQKVENLKTAYEELLVRIYVALARHVVASCWLPQLQSAYYANKEEIASHKKQHEPHYQRALGYYDEALCYRPKAAELYFDKAVILDWIIEFEDAFEFYQKAVEYNPCNPFYHKCLGRMHGALYCNRKKQEEHNQIAAKYAPVEFEDDYRIWIDEHMSKVKTKDIDPHKYKK